MFKGIWIEIPHFLPDYVVPARTYLSGWQVDVRNDRWLHREGEGEKVRLHRTFSPSPISQETLSFRMEPERNEESH